HAEAGGVRRGNQLFGVRAFLPLEPSRERVRTVERAAAGLEVPFPVLELAFPDRHRLTRGHRPDSAGGESGKSGGTAEGTLRLGRASPATERKTDDGHEEKAGPASRQETPAVPSPAAAARVAAAPLHGRLVHGERPGQEHRVVSGCAGLHRRRALGRGGRSEEHTSELQSRSDLVCRLLLEKKNKNIREETYLAGR